MRVARDFAVGGIRPYHAPERPRVADPDRRRRIADYLSGGTTIGRGHGPEVLHTDGMWLWPERFVGEIVDDGLAPEPDFTQQMHACGFRPPAPESGARLNEEALTAWRGGPPPPSRLLITYFVRVDEGSALDSPLSLLRRMVDPVGGVTEEAVWRDMLWHATNTFVSPKADDDIREVGPDRAAGILDRWCAKWHAEAVTRRTGTGP